MKFAIVLALLAGCATVKAEVKEYADGAVVCLDKYKPRAEALGKSLLSHAATSLISGQTPEVAFKAVEAEATAAIAAVGLPVAACSFSDLVDELGRLFRKSGDAPARALAVTDPLAPARAALVSFMTANGVTSIYHE